MNLLEKMMPGLALSRQIKRTELARLKAVQQSLESLPSWARDNDESGWLKIMTDNPTDPYTPSDLLDMRSVCRKLRLTNPDARNVIDTMLNFCIGRYAKWTAVDDLPETQNYLDEFWETNRLDKRQKEWLERLLVDGETFLRIYEPNNTDGQLIVRFLEPDNIIQPSDGGNEWTHGIKTDVDDIENVIAYNYKYLDQFGRESQEEIPANQIIHTKIYARSNQKRGVSFLVGIGRYIKAYENWLDDRIKLNRLRHMWAIIMKPVAGTSPTSFASSNFADVERGADTTGGTANKKAINAGSILISQGLETEMQSLNLQATDTAQDGRAIELMIAKGTQLAEYMIRGDASNANYASTMVAESPPVKSFERWQDIFADPQIELGRIVLERAIRLGQIPEKHKRELVVPKKPKEAPDGTKDFGQTRVKREDVITSTEITVDYQTLIHRDMKQETEAYILQESLSIASKRTIAGKLGYDYDEEQEKRDREKREDSEREQTFSPMDRPGGTPAANEKPEEDEE